MRLLIWLVIGLAVVVWLKRFLASLAHQGQPTPGTAQSGAARQRQSEVMVQCAHCGVHFPASEALAGADGAVYCCAEHRQLERQ